MGLGPEARRGGAQAAINITPLVDIVLVMLVIFIVAVPAVNREIPVEVPPASDGTPPQQHPITLEVRADQSVVIDDNRGGRTEVRRADLALALRPQLLRQGTASTVFLDIAEPVAWRDAIGVMDTVRGVGAGADRDLTIALPVESRLQ